MTGLAINTNVAVRLANEPIDLTSYPNPVPLPTSFVVKNRSKNSSVNGSFFHSYAGVRNSNHHVLTRLNRFGKRRHIGIIQADVGGFYCEVTAAGHCIPRIYSQIDHRTFQLGCICLCAPKSASGNHLQRNGFPES